MDSSNRIDQNSTNLRPPVSPESASPLQQRTSSTAVEALQPPAVVSADPINAETITLAKGSITIKAAEIPLLGPLEHKILNTTFNKAFYKKVLTYFLNPKAEKPVIQSERDLACLEYCFFQAYAKKDLSQIYLISNLMTEQRPDETTTKLVFLYVTYKYFEEIYSFEEVQNAIMDIGAQIDSTILKEVLLIALGASRKAGKPDNEIEILMNLYHMEPSDPRWNLESAFHANSHRSDFIRAWMRVSCSPAITNPVIFNELAEVRTLMASRQFEKALELADRFLNQTESQSNDAGISKARNSMDLTKTQILFRLGRKEESKALIQKIRSVPVIIEGNIDLEEKEISALVAEGNYEKALRMANEFLRKTKNLAKDVSNLEYRNSVSVSKIRALLNLGQFTECEEFAKKVKSECPKFISATIAGYKKEESAYALYADYFVSTKKQLFVFFAILEFCALTKNVPVKFHPIFGDRLLQAATMHPKCLPVWQALNRMLNFDQFRIPPVLREEIVQRCVGLDPANSHFYRYGYANWLLRHGELEKSIELTDNIRAFILEKSIDDEDFLVRIEDLLRKQNRRETIAPFYKDMYQKTQDGNILVRYVKALIDIQKREVGISTLEEHIQKYPDSIQALKYLCFMLYQDKRFEEALGYGKRALAINGDDRVAQVHTGLSYAAMANFEAAISLLAKNDRARSGQTTIPDESYIAILFICYVETHQLKKAAAILKKSSVIIPDGMRREYEEKLAIAKETKLMNTWLSKEIGKQEVSAIRSFEDKIKEHSTISKTQTVKPIDFPTVPILSIAPSEPIRNVVPKAKLHLQPSKDVTNLDANKKLKEWLNNPRLANVCTTDEEFAKAPMPLAASVKQEFKEVKLEALLSKHEFERLERARQHLIQIGDLLVQEKERTTKNPEDPGNFLFPRVLMYNVLKFGEALAPTGRDQHLIGKEFKDTIQTHIISTKLILSLRSTMRHKAQLVDLVKLKKICHVLKESTVLRNIEGYMDGHMKKVVVFTNRAPIAVKQDIKRDKVDEEVVDYLAEAQMELRKMSAIGGKMLQEDIDKELFYKEGLKMALCNLEEDIKRLNLPEDRELWEIFYFGNKVGHEMGQGNDPKLYNNEEIRIERLYSIIKKAERISHRLTTLAKK